MSDVSTYYDEFADHQESLGINQRHRSIMRFLLLHGLTPTDRVLEIGAGIGTQTQLIAEYLVQGEIVMNDISERSVGMAKERLSKHKNIQFLAGDILQTPVEGLFDAVVCPDVLEHIPMEQHAELFKQFDKLLNPSGVIFIHIPSPFFMEWLHKNKPEVLQVIDQALHTEHIMDSLKGTQFYLHHLETYELFYHDCDYQFIILKKRGTQNFKEIINPGEAFHKRITKRLNLAAKALFSQPK